MARPLYLGGYQPEPSDRATPKLAPATPRITPIKITPVSDFTTRKPTARPMEMRPISTCAAFLRPMYCERMPSGNRIRAPAMTGTEIMNPF
jgi:hypothetical protein